MPSRPRDPFFDALAESAEGVPAGGTATSGGKIGKALQVIRQADPEVTPTEIRRRAREYLFSMPPGTVLTATALAAHWHRCDGKHRRPAQKADLYRSEESERLRNAF